MTLFGVDIPGIGGNVNIDIGPLPPIPGSGPATAPSDPTHLPQLPTGTPTILPKPGTAGTGGGLWATLYDRMSQAGLGPNNGVIPGTSEPAIAQTLAGGNPITAGLSAVVQNYAISGALVIGILIAAAALIFDKEDVQAALRAAPALLEG